VASALVLGSSGMVGRAVVSRLRELGASVVGANRSGLDGAMVLDAADPPPLESLIAGADLVVNAIGLLRSDPAYPSQDYALRAARVNTVFPLLLAQAAQRQAARVIHVSTDAVFSPGESPADESTPVSPSEPYGLSKALGEANVEQVLNIRCSVVGPAPGRPDGLWEWFVSQPSGAEVQAFDVPWTGVTSMQLAVLVGDLFDRVAFEQARSSGRVHHFVPNGSSSKYALLSALREALRPDLRVMKASNAALGRELISVTGALEAVFSGSRGWDAAIREAAR
jgi:dTDP-4-dehydrorhamnose reductase